MVENLFVKKDLLSSLNALILTNEKNWILTGHVIFKLSYNQIYQLKTTFTYWQHKKRKKLDIHISEFLSPFCTWVFGI